MSATRKLAPGSRKEICREWIQTFGKHCKRGENCAFQHPEKLVALKPDCSKARCPYAVMPGGCQARKRKNCNDYDHPFTHAETQMWIEDERRDRAAATAYSS